MVGARSRSSWFRLLGSSVTIVVLACGGGGGGGGGGPAGPPGGGGGGQPAGDITTPANTFRPMEFTVQAGSRVVWVNSNGEPHTVTSDAARFARGLIETRNSTYGVTFNAVGDFPYHCEFHGAPGSGMHGTIRVTQ
jgi:plastocyanin